MIVKVHSFVPDETLVAPTVYLANEENAMYREKYGKIVKHTSGKVLVYSLLMMSALFGSGGIGYWYESERSMHAAAGSAAVAGSFEALSGGNNAAVEAATKAEAATSADASS